jgi:hypothetical protein
MRSLFLAQLLVLFVGLFSPEFTFAQDTLSSRSSMVTQVNTVRDLRDRLLVYDAEYGTYIPFIEELHAGYNAVHCWIGKNEYQGYLLNLTTVPDLCLLVNQRLYKHYTQRDVVEVNIGKFETAQDNKQIFLTFYHPQSAYRAIGEPRLVYKTEVPAVTYQLARHTVDYKPFVRSTTRLNNLFVICFVALLAMYVGIKNFSPSLFFSFFNVKGMLSQNIVEYGGVLRKSLNRSTVLIIVGNSLCIGFVLLLIQQGLIASGLSQKPAQETLFDFAGLFLRYSAIGLMYYVFKFGLVYGMGFLFRIGNFSNAHYYEFIRYSTITSVILLLVAFFQYNTYFFSQELFFEVVKIIVFGLIIMRIIKVALMLNSSIPFRNLYLFSYLCGTELIPIVIIAKYYQFGL